MDVTISGLYKSISAFFKKMSKRMRLTLIVSAVLLLIGAVVLSKVLDNASYTVLYRGLASSESVQVINLLDSSGVPYRLETDGTILVPRDQEAKLKMQLASDGFPNSTLGYDTFTSQADLMTTDYEKRQYLIFQLQDRLQDSLKTLTGVKDAIVTLNVPDDNSYVLKSDQPESSAAVVLDLYSYADLSAKQIKGIEELVAKSVPGLKNENVIIVDGQGTVLNDKAEDTSGTELADNQIEIIDKINKLYEDKIAKFLEPVFGSDGVSVSVNVKMNFQQKNTQQTIYTPVVGESSGILSSMEGSRQSTNGATLPDSGVGAEANVGVPSYQDAQATATPSPTDNANNNANSTGNNSTQAGNTGSASESYDNDYLVNQVVETALDNGGQIEDMTVSLMINSRDLTPDTVDKYKQMVAYGVGISTDKVFISYAEFLAKPETPVYADPGQTASSASALSLPLALPTNVLLYGGAGLGGLILLLIVLLLLRRRGKKRSAAKLAAESRLTPEGAPAEGAGEATEAPMVPPIPREKKPIPGEIVLSETREQALIRQVKEFTTVNPDIVAQLLRAWMKEENK
jgi:flagellar M-ring protein FliF